ncbi:MAG: acetyl-CoA carboxylase biotin carboxyl carrier protein [Campylobacteraceae bacterium]|nr:acetyl-CoA carboxylase biotin carboxyl carrier protein [Campylobacteraceae bacterium]
MKQQDIKDLMEFFDTTGASRLKIKDGEFEIEMEKGSASAPSTQTFIQAPSQAPVPSANPEVLPICEPAQSIKSPMVGTFYQAPAPGSAAFVKVGQSVKKGQVIAIVEAMKIMNEIEAEFDCKIISILVDDGQPVEFDMPLFGVEKF